ncbi:TolC family protein [Mucilaginibacter paludis]|uniref:Outer membrane efflux protein n=1 Tax=Mucilaginibacter paludis DSM 18603 TaxID=714943 RepID=H1YHY4_9SPHI|nr:TolC family protein [Mucilaginibacter paludis]EHQ25532.1 outer membrane efflux protein [Mucilaginibacter paludis DSM 18603]
MSHNFSIKDLLFDHMSYCIKLFSITIYLLLIENLSAFSQVKLSLKQAINIALTDNLQVKQSQVTESIANQNFRQSKFNILPTLNANINESLNFGRSLDYTTYSYVTQKTNLANESITTSVTLFQGLQKINQIAANRLLFQSDKSATQKVKNDLMLEVINNYITILSSQDQLTAAQQQLDLAKQQLDVSTKIFNAGKKMASDVSVAKSQVAKAELNITTIQNQLNNSVVNFKQLLNLSPETKINLSEPKNDEVQFQEKATLDIYNKALHVLPETNKALYARLYAEKQVMIQKGAYYPSIVLSSGIASNYSHILGMDSMFFTPQSRFLTQFKINLTEYVQVSLSIPIFNNFSTRINVKKAKLDLESARLDEETTKNEIYKVVNQANEDLTAAKKTYEYSKEEYNATLDTYNTMYKRYLTGLSNPIDVNQAQNEMNSAQFDLIHAKYDLLLKSEIIDFYQGRSMDY